MAIISTLIGGIGGFFTFAGALLFFDTSFLTAVSLYFIVGLGLATSLVAASLVWRGLSGLSSHPVEIVARPAQVQAARNSLPH